MLQLGQDCVLETKLRMLTCPSIRCVTTYVHCIALVDCMVCIGGLRVCYGQVHGRVRGFLYGYQGVFVLVFLDTLLWYEKWNFNDGPARMDYGGDREQELCVHEWLASMNRYGRSGTFAYPQCLFFLLPVPRSPMQRRAQGLDDCRRFAAGHTPK